MFDCVCVGCSGLQDLDFVDVIKRKNPLEYENIDNSRRMMNDRRVSASIMGRREEDCSGCHICRVSASTMGSREEDCI